MAPLPPGAWSAFFSGGKTTIDLLEAGDPRLKWITPSGSHSCAALSSHTFSSVHFR